MQPERKGFDKYVTTIHFLVNGVQWEINTVCTVYNTGHIYKATGKCLQHDEENHERLNQLVLMQASDLFNYLIGSDCNNIELGMNDFCKQYGGYAQQARGYIFNNKIELCYAQNASYFRTEKEFKPFFNLLHREW